MYKITQLKIKLVVVKDIIKPHEFESHVTGTIAVQDCCIQGENFPDDRKP